MGVVPTAGQLLDVNNNNSSNRDRDRDHNKPLLVPPHTAEREYDTAADSILSSQRPSVSPVLSLSLNVSLANMDIHTHTHTHTLSLSPSLSLSLFPSRYIRPPQRSVGVSVVQAVCSGLSGCGVLQAEREGPR